MAANFETNYIINAKINQVVGALRNPAFCTELNLDFISERPVPGGVWYQYSHSVSFSSWGEDITMSLTPINDTSTQIAIRSECSMPTQIVDWGKNKKMVKSICDYLQANAYRYPLDQPMPEGAQPHYQAPQPQYQAPQPQYQAPQPQYQAPQPQYQAPAQAFCWNCRRPLPAVGRFCPVCGAKVR